MKRLLGILVATAATAGFVALTVGAGGHEAGSPNYWVELDNAFGLVNGADVKVAGVRAGKITGMKVDMHSHRALVGIQIDGGRGDFNSLRSDVSCESRPQSLIGEYFIDCQPGTAGAKLKPGTTIGVAQTTSTIPPDLVQNILRLPYRQRLRVIVNELGTGVAGREGDLNAAIRRASPALRETDKVLAILAQENRVIRDLTANADTVITALANNKANVARWVVEARNAARASANRNVDLAATWAKLPGFLEQLRPAMAALGRAADAQTPALQDLNATSGELRRFFADLGPFADASRPSLRSLGDASVVGRQAVRNGRTSVNLLKSFAGPLPEVGKNLAIILGDLDNPARNVEADPRAAQQSGRPAPTGYSGLEALLQYAFDQEQTTNVFDTNSYILKVSLFGNDCAAYRNADTLRSSAPVSPQPGAPTGQQLAKECSTALGPNQPGINQPDPSTVRAASVNSRESSARAAPGARGVTPTSPGSQPATNAPASGGGGGHSAPAPAQAPPIDIKRTLDQLLGGKVPLPGGVPLPSQLPKSLPQNSEKSAQDLLNYLLAP